MLRVRLLPGLLLFVMICVALPADARVRKHEFGYGFGAGVAYTNASGSTLTQAGFDRSGGSGFVGSLFGIWNITQQLSFQPGLQYVDRGFEYRADPADVVQEIGIDTRYVDIPLIVNWDFMPREYIGPHVFAGPVFSVLVHDQARVDFVQPNAGNPKLDIGNTNPLTLGFAGGARMSFPARRDRAFIELRGRFDVTSFLSATDANGIEYKHSAGELLIGAPGSTEARHWQISVMVGFLLE